jgi:hypothetical protein
VAAPVGGLNSRDPLAAMKPEDALVLDNFICRPTSVELRKGQATYATLPSTDQQVYSLLPYRDGGTGKLFAGTDAGVYDCTAGGALTTTVASCTSGKWIGINSANAGIRYLVMVNGVDSPIFYNGTVWATSVITNGGAGFDSKKLNNIYQHNFRLYFTYEGSLSFYYLAVNAVQGAATEFPLGGIFRKGGALVAVASWSVDSGTGADDFAVFITTEGEMAIYRGIDPDNAATWELAGIFELPKPIGKKCAYRMGGELLIITESGIVSASKFLQSIAVDRTTSLSDKTRGELSSLATAYKTVFGWECLRYSNEDLLIVNVPNSTQTSTVQMCMNTLTGAWSKFKEMPANCFAEFNGSLYYGGKGSVVKALTGTDDFGANITATAKTAFNYFGMGVQRKHVALLRPNFYLSKKVLISFALSPDFQIDDVISQSSSSPNGISLFDVSHWDQSYWAGESFTDDQWRTVFQKPGYCIALLLQVNEKDLELNWNTTDYLISLGGVF